MNIFAHAGHDHGEVAAASTQLDNTNLILILVSLALITAAVILIIFVHASVKRIKQIDGTHKTKKADEFLRDTES